VGSRPTGHTPVGGVTAPGDNLNALTDADRFEHLTGTAVLTGFEVTVEPA
jgi:hypothetical protein